MESRLFRQKSVERITSPEQLQDYMRVTNPGMWMVLLAVIAILAGLLISSALVKLESTVPLKGEVAENSIYMKLELNQKDLVQTGMKVRVGEQTATVAFIYEDQENLGVFAELDDKDATLPDGTYDVEIITETITPISLLLR